MMKGIIFYLILFTPFVSAEEKMPEGIYNVAYKDCENKMRKDYLITDNEAIHTYCTQVIMEVWEKHKEAIISEEEERVSLSKSSLDSLFLWVQHIPIDSETGRDILDTVFFWAD